jgi:hypothetical protein
MHSKFRTKARNRRGQSFVEMAFLIPALMIALFLMLEVSWWLRSYMVIGTAAREGARFGSRSPNVSISSHQKSVDVADLTVNSMEEIIEVDMLGATQNARVFVTLIQIDEDGTMRVLNSGSAYYTGEYPASSRVCFSGACAAGYFDVQDAVQSNLDFSAEAAFCPETEVCNNDLVIVEVFYRHEPLILQSNLLPDGILTYSRSVMRVVLDRPMSAAPSGPEFVRVSGDVEILAN